MAAAERTLERQAAFAARMGWNKSTVTRLKQHGRLVMDGSRVDVEASIKRIEETGGMRDDVAERHAAARAGKGGKAPEAPARGENRADAQARKEAAAADLLEIELAQKRGQVIAKDDVDQALKALATAVRTRIDVLPDQLAPLVAPVTDLQEVHALLAEHGRLILSGVADELQRAAETLGKVPT